MDVYFDNDDEFKTYQREFRKLAVQVSEDKLDIALKTAENKRKEYENKYNLELIAYNSKNIEIDSLNANLEYIKGLSYKATMDYLFQKAEVDGLKYLYEDEIVHSKDHSDGYHTNYIYEEKYFSELEKMNALKLEKENYELQVSNIENTLKTLKSDLK